MPHHIYLLLLQEFVLQKKQRESLSNQSQEEMGEVPEAEATDAEVPNFLPLNILATLVALDLTPVRKRASDSFGLA